LLGLSELSCGRAANVLPQKGLLLAEDLLLDIWVTVEQLLAVRVMGHHFLVDLLVSRRLLRLLNIVDDALCVCCLVAGLVAHLEQP
jgi:hypothetical protein